jgi:predicted GNAT family acetyltransferase
MNVRERRIRGADTDDINLVSAFDEELGSNERKEAVRCATEGKNAYVLEQDHRVIAVGILEYTFFQQGFISLVYVDPRERRTGAGELLSGHFVSACRTPKLFSSTNLTNIPMQTLFAKLGFTLSGVIHNLDANDPELIYFEDPSVQKELE